MTDRCNARTVNALVLASLTLFVGPVRAFVDPPVLATPDPGPGQAVSISILAGVCDLLAADPPPTITRRGNNVHVIVQSAMSFDLEYCTYPTITTNIVVGTFEAGTYQLQVDRVYPSGDGLVTAPIGSLVLIVVAAEGVPVLGTLGNFILASVLALACFLAVFARRPTPVA